MGHWPQDRREKGQEEEYNKEFTHGAMLSTKKT